MAAIGQPFTDTVPAVGTSGTAYASTINAILQECMDRLSVAIPTGSIAAATSDLDFNNRALTNASYVGMYEQATTPSGAPYGRLVVFGGDLYYVGTSGVVQITSAATVNVSSTGGIGGDYGVGGNPALLKFVDSTETYEFYDNEPSTQWAIVKARQLGLIDETASLTVSIRPSATIAANYTIVLPTNDPASGVSLLSMNSSGELAHGVTISNAETFSNTVTFSADPVLSGSTNVRHGDRILQIGLNPLSDTGLADPGAANIGRLITNAASVTIEIPLTLQQGWRVKTITTRGNKGTAAVATLYYRRRPLGLSVVDIGTDTSTTSGSYTLDITGLTDTVVANSTYWVSLELPVSGDTLDLLEVTYDVVA